jgi:nitrogen-specific signal transduction histidine kinase
LNSTVVRNPLHAFQRPVEKIDLNKAIESTITVARNEWKYVAEVTFRPDPDLPPVPCLPGEINQVFLHLVMNAAQAIGEVVREGDPKGSIVIETRHTDRFVEVRVARDRPSLGRAGPSVPAQALRRRSHQGYTQSAGHAPRADGLGGAARGHRVTRIVAQPAQSL